MTLQNRGRGIATLLCALALVCATTTVASAAGPRVIDIKATDDMKYSVTHIDAKPGESLKVVLTAVGAQAKEQMAHNFILLKPGTDATMFVTMAAMAKATDYVPASQKDKILVMTPHLVGAGETTDVTFKAPDKPGTYQYVCSFPGHFLAGMKGELVVK